VGYCKRRSITRSKYLLAQGREFGSSLLDPDPVQKRINVLTPILDTVNLSELRCRNLSSLTEKAHTLPL